jgi:hypothetical protein
MPYDLRHDLLDQIRHWLKACNATRPRHVHLCFEDAWTGMSIDELYDVIEELRSMAG